LTVCKGKLKILPIFYPNTEMSRLANVHKTLLEMFAQRGYHDVDSTEENRILAVTTDGTQVCAYSNIIQKLNADTIKSYIASLQSASISHGLLVFDGTVTPIVKNIVENLPDLQMNIELFAADDLQYNITEHKLVPKHILMSKEEILAFKKKFGVKIPKMLRSDPISRFYGLQKGDIVKVIRREGHVSFRLVK